MNWPNGKEYSGKWRDSLMHGRGALKYADGRLFIGNFVKDIKEGRGRFDWPDGRSYDGYWSNGKQDGPGVISNAKG